jgi:hypothetical protein
VLQRYGRERERDTFLNLFVCKLVSFFSSHKNDDEMDEREKKNPDLY